MKKLKILIGILAAILMILCAVVFCLEKGIIKRQNKGEDVPKDTYSWEEYQGLSLEEQDAFFQTFDSVEDFEAWLESVKPAASIQQDAVWDETGKKPDAYTWAEYQALSPQEQDAFYRWFASAEAFEAWMSKVRPAEESTVKWDKPGKNPDSYTWAEYQALSLKEQDAFYQWFGSKDAFEAWMKKVKPAQEEESTVKWDKPGKSPDSYTWAEYQALSPQEQDAFFLWFGSVDAFEAWMKKVKPAEESTVKWDKPGKDPDSYTWAEYEALSLKEQDAFYQWFGSKDAFETWMKKVKPAQEEESAVKWDKPGKSPDSYTWAEYQALSPQEQDAFFLWFGSVDAFEVWMEKVK